SQGQMTGAPGQIREWLANYADRGHGALPFPDFSKIKIHRPTHGKPGEQKEITINLLNTTNALDCAKDVRLEFGDVVEVPEREHTLAERAVGLTKAQSGDLTKGREREVTFAMK